MYIFGASGHAKVIVDILGPEDKVHGVFDDDPSRSGLLEFPVLGAVPDGFTFDQPLFIAVGDNRQRKSTYLRYKDRADFASIRHASAIISSRASLGAGSVLMEGSMVKVAARLGKQVIINTGASVDHDCRLSDFVHIAPGSILCGGVQVGEGSLVGAGSTVLPGIQIGEWVSIGAGSVVTRNVPDGHTWIGNRLKETP